MHTRLVVPEAIRLVDGHEMWPSAAPVTFEGPPMPQLRLEQARAYYQKNQNTFAVLTEDGVETAVYHVFEVESGTFTGDWRWSYHRSVFELVGIYGAPGDVAPVSISPSAPDTRVPA